MCPSRPTDLLQWKTPPLLHTQERCRPGRCRGLHPPSSPCGWLGSGSHLSVQCLREEGNDDFHLWCGLVEFFRKRTLNYKCRPLSQAIISDSKATAASSPLASMRIQRGPEYSPSKAVQWTRVGIWIATFSISNKSKNNVDFRQHLQDISATKESQTYSTHLSLPQVSRYL